MFSEIKLRNEIKNALEDLTENNIQTPDTRNTAEGFRKILESFHATLLTMIWEEILQSVEKTSEILQKEELDFLCAKELQTLSWYYLKKSNFDDNEAKSLQLTNVPKTNYEKSEKEILFR
ncbi:dimer_Tnp_hAT domain-containing protein [Trichonephila clavipes]|nr:dimer_Tnp_hAT domain-containing protein [Trichonephila clavipes]